MNLSGALLLVPISSVCCWRCKRKCYQKCCQRVKKIFLSKKFM